MAATARSLSLSRQMSVPRLSLEGVIILARITTQAHLLFPAPNCLRGRRICTLDHRYSLSIYRRRRERPCPRPSYSAALSGARYRRSQLSIAVALRARITSARIISPPPFPPRILRRSRICPLYFAIMANARSMPAPPAPKGVVL